MEPRVSIVVLTMNEGALLRRTIDSLRASVPDSTEIVVVDDGSTDSSTGFLAGGYPARLVRGERPLGIAAGRNLGAGVARGEVIVFSDAHVEVERGWLGPLLDALADPAVAEVAPEIGSLDRRPARGYGFTWPDLSLRMKWLVDRPEGAADAPFLCGCFVAVRRDAFQAAGGFDEGMYRWGCEDAELSLRFWLLGYRCQVVPSSSAFHLFRREFPYEVDAAGVLANTLRLGVLHFDERRLARLVRHHARRPAFAGAWTRLLAGDAWRRRRELDARRVRDLEWFVARHGVRAIA
jgi:GT2 family glycosyltransferase